MKLTPEKLGVGIILAGLVSLGASLWDWSLPGSQARPQAGKIDAQCRVLQVSDGDTVECDLNGNGRLEKPVELVRFLGIDTPEMRYSKKNRTYGSPTAQDEPFAPEASRYAAQALSGRVIYLEYDETRRDIRGRTLAYVYRDAAGRQSVGEALLRQGYAEALFFAPNLRHQTRYQAIENEARRAGRGLWSVSQQR